MFDQEIHSVSLRVRENDLIACNLLKCIDRYEQFAILYELDWALLIRIFDAALQQEEYEICQVICSLMEERKEILNLG
jgi:hypothetical protein